MAATIWFNKYLSNTWAMLELLRADSRPGEFRILSTHPRHNASLPQVLRRVVELDEQRRLAGFVLPKLTRHNLT